MKKISILFNLVLLFIAIFSCEQQMEINSLKSIDSNISIDKNSQINLEPTTLSKEQIENNSCGEVKITTLFAGQNLDIGNIMIYNDEANLYVTYDVEKGNWWLEETHLFVGNYSDIPFTGAGNPKIGHFPYHGDHDQTQNYTFTIPISELDDCFVVIAHASAVQKDDDKNTGSETAFGFGEEEFDGSRWGWYFEYCQQQCGENDNDDSNDDSNNNDANECLNAFAYNASKTKCFTYTDSNLITHATWSNQFNFYEQKNQHFTLPLYAAVDNCGIDPISNTNTLEVGYVDIYLFTEGIGDGMQMFTTVKYIINNDAYELSNINLYLSNTVKPTDLDPSNGYYNYNETSDFWNSNENSLEKLPWPGTYNAWDTYFIPYAMVCKVKSTN